MNRFYFYYPTKPFVVTQAWGVFNEDPKNPGHSIYEPFGFTLHNGTDARVDAPYAKETYHVHAPFPALVVDIGYHPKGSGIYLSILSDGYFDFRDGVRARVLMDFLHLKKTLAPIRAHVEVGELLAMADNTGFSTGLHTHIQARRVKGEAGALTFADRNQANNSFDTMVYSKGLSAIDRATFTTIITKNYPRILAYLAGLK